MPATNSPIIPNIADQHLEEAAFLWVQRDEAVGAPHYSLKELTQLDDRLDAHIDGLRIVSDDSWEICVDGLAEPEPDVGTVFVASLLAFESGHGDRIDIALSSGYKSYEKFREMVSALGWIEQQRLGPILAQILNANSVDYKRLGIAASVIRRQDPGPLLDRFISEPDDFSKARALRAVGELKRHDLLPNLNRTKWENTDCRFWAAWSSIMLGDYSTLPVVQQYVLSDSSLKDHALQLALRVMDPSSAQQWLHELGQKPENLRIVVLASGICGDPIYLPFLLSLMENPAMARVAGEAFTMITGVDLADEDLEGEWPEGFEAGPNDDPEDPDVAMDRDEDLPWPNATLISKWWQANQNRFNTGTRYLTGKPITLEHCHSVLQNGMQRQRQAAALELALRDKNDPLFNVAAPGNSQLVALSARHK